MSNAIRKDVEELTQKELKSANEKFPLFASNHEAYAVLLEEIEEAKEDFGMIDDTKHYIWDEIRSNHKISSPLLTLKAVSESLACEAIQVAAMAQKTIDSEERRKNNE